MLARPPPLTPEERALRRLARHADDALYYTLRDFEAHALQRVGYAHGKTRAQPGAVVPLVPLLAAVALVGKGARLGADDMLALRARVERAMNWHERTIAALEAFRDEVSRGELTLATFSNAHEYVEQLRAAARAVWEHAQALRTRAESQQQPQPQPQPQPPDDGRARTGAHLAWLERAVRAFLATGPEDRTPTAFADFVLCAGTPAALRDEVRAHVIPPAGATEIALCARALNSALPADARLDPADPLLVLPFGALEL